MRKILFLCTMILNISISANNDEINRILASIEQNNGNLKALRIEADARIEGNREEMMPDDPEAEFAYLWGSPHEIGKRQDVNVSQGFDIPLITGMKKKVVSRENELVELNHQSERTHLLLEAKKLCIELIYNNALRDQQDKQLQWVEHVADAYRKQYEKGNIGTLAYNNVQLYLTEIKHEVSRMGIEQKRILSELKRLNGGIAVELTGTQYDLHPLPADFEQWFGQMEQKNPMLKYAYKESELNTYRIKVAKKANLPRFSVGYLMENVVGERYQGVTLGISVPLWRNSQRLQQAKSEAKASEMHAATMRQEFYDAFRAIYQQAQGLQQLILDYHASMRLYDNAELLEKALDLGNISIMDYISEKRLYYERITKVLEAERDYELLYAELTYVEL
ncbi:TolC family protein [Anaerorudis cellulosivorans]|uniref:TolC family protein n=1 Tax=Anaerorudis cellulosivorans TaxID=3397862 RepID=UPI0022200820|nr:TolC family protein [Seramator thermalis]MCW1735358.1 TolC family protein [Seramator thermalis]